MDISNNSFNFSDASRKNFASLKKTSWKWLALFFLNLTLAGDYFCYDNPQALQTHLQIDLDIDAEAYNGLYTVYSIPNIILPLLGGKLIEFLGVRVALTLFSTLVMIGQILVCIGGFAESFTVLFFGRAIYGFGGDCLTVAETFFITQWFSGAELAFAFSFQDLTNGLFSGLNSAITPELYNWTGNLGCPLAVGAALCIVSFLSAVAMVILDKVNDQKEVRSRPRIYVQEGEGFNLPELFRFPTLYWLIVLNYAFQAGAFYNFTNIANGYLVTRYAFSPISAGMLIAIFIYGVGGFFPPFWGKVIDAYGNRVSLIFMAGMFLFLANGIMIISPDCNKTCYWPVPVIPLCLYGLYISISDSLTYPSFPIFLSEKKLGTAFGGALVVSNVALTFGPAICGIILDQAPDYDIGYMRISGFLMGISATGLTVVGALYWVDRKQDGSLQKIYREVESVKEDSPAIESEGEFYSCRDEKENLRADFSDDHSGGDYSAVSKQSML